MQSAVPAELRQSFPRKPDVLTREEEHQLAVKARAGDKAAREELVCRNIGLAFSIAAKHAHKRRDTSEAYEDSLIGLMKAVDRFDPYAGIKFSTYAHWWIKESILERGIYTNERLIRYPERMEKDIRKKLATGTGPGDIRQPGALLLADILPEGVNLSLEALSAGSEIEGEIEYNLLVYRVKDAVETMPEHLQAAFYDLAQLPPPENLKEFGPVKRRWKTQARTKVREALGL